MSNELTATQILISLNPLYMKCGRCCYYFNIENSRKIYPHDCDEIRMCVICYWYITMSHKRLYEEMKRHFLSDIHLLYAPIYKIKYDPNREDYVIYDNPNS